MLLCFPSLLQATVGFLSKSQLRRLQGGGTLKPEKLAKLGDTYKFYILQDGVKQSQMPKVRGLVRVRMGVRPVRW